MTNYLISDHGDRPNKSDIRHLLEQAISGDPGERFEAVGELTLHDTPEVNEALVRAVRDPDPDVAATALDALAERGHPQARELVLECLGARSLKRVRERALRTAGVVDIGPHLEQAWRALDKHDWISRAVAAEALATAGAMDALPAIRALAQRARSVGQPRAEAHLLGSAALFGDKEAAALFLSRLSSRAQKSRGAAAAFLDRRGRLETLVRTVGVRRLREAILLANQREKAEHREALRTHRLETLLRRLEGLSSAET